VSRALNIGIFTRSLPLHQVGGFERHTETLALALAGCGHAVTLITSRLPARPLPSPLRAVIAQPHDVRPAAPGEVRVVACRRGLSGRYELGYAPATRDLFARLHARRRFDLVVGAGWGAAALVPSRRWAAARVPAAMIAHGTPRAELAAKRRRLGAGPRYLAHALRHRLEQPGRRRALHAFDRVIAVSDSVAQRLRDEFALPESRLAIVTNGIEVDAFATAVARETAALGARACAPTLLVTGRLHAEKGIAVLLRAMTLLAARPRAPRLLIAGEGRDRPALERLAAARLPRERVVFEGFVASDALPRLLAEAHLYIFPSTCDEGLPLALLEAMAAGLPIVASRVAGVTDAVRDRREALLVPSGDAPALAAAIDALLDDPAQAQALGRAAQERCRREFSAQRMRRELTLELTRLANRT
jgi:glycosyltransferase involved in cell wall biosynthesis